MIFQSKATATYRAVDSADETKTLSLAGGTRADTVTPEEAAENINKLLDVVGKECVADGMTRTVTEEAIEE